MKHNTDPTSRHITPRQLIGAAIASISIAASGGGLSAEQVQASHGQDRIDPIENSYLRKPSTLEGYNKPLLPEAKNKLTNSTVKIGMRHEESTEPYQLLTGVKVNSPEGSYIYTSAHGFYDLTGDEEGLIDGSLSQPPAYNYIERANNRKTIYEIFDPLVPKKERIAIARVTGISISNRNQDQAALSVEPINNGHHGSSRAYSEIGSMPLATEQKKAAPRPMRGQRVFLLGVPEAVGDRQLTGLGRYLGRIKLPVFDGGTQILDVVGIKPQTEAQDNCNFGASGSSFSATSKKGKTYFSGSLAQRINDQWDPSKIDSQRDFTDQRGDITNEISAIQQRKAMFAEILGVNLDSFKTICGFSVNLPITAKNLMLGFKTPAPPEDLSRGKGGFDSMK